MIFLENIHTIALQSHCVHAQSKLQLWLHKHLPVRSWVMPTTWVLSKLLQTPGPWSSPFISWNSFFLLAKFPISRLNPPFLMVYASMSEGCVSSMWVSSQDLISTCKTPIFSLFQSSSRSLCESSPARNLHRHIEIQQLWRCRTWTKTTLVCWVENLPWPNPLSAMIFANSSLMLVIFQFAMFTRGHKKHDVIYVTDTWI